MSFIMYNPDNGEDAKRDTHLSSERVITADSHGEVDEEEDAHGNDGRDVELAAVRHIRLNRGEGGRSRKCKHDRAKS